MPGAESKGEIWDPLQKNENHFGGHWNPGRGDNIVLSSLIRQQKD